MKRKDEILSEYDWPVNENSFSPGFEYSWDDVRYLDGNSEGYTYLVAEELFYPMDEQQYVINNEFILLFNLYRGADGDYYHIGESGEREKVISLRGPVRFLTKYLMRFIAAKQVLFVQLVDSMFGSSKYCPMNRKEVYSDCRKGTGEKAEMAEDLRHNRRNSCRRSAASYG
jgi:hypothetical protein